MAYVDFALLKQRVSIEQVLAAYNIPIKKSGSQLRGPCPICGTSAKRAFVATPGENLWHCFGECDAGGDIITLVSKLNDIRPKEAALDIQERCLGDTKEQPNPTPKAESKGLKPLDLVHDHDKVKELGIPTEIAEQLGVGYCKVGIMRGRVAFPLRDPDGELIAYCGYSFKDKSLKLPKFEGL